MKCRYVFMISMALLAAAGHWQGAQAEESVGESDSSADAPRRMAGTGAFLPLTQSATLNGQRASGVAMGGYDSARKGGLFGAAAEARVWKGLTLRGGAAYIGSTGSTGSTGSLRPSFGARYQFLSEAHHGIDGGLGVFYQPEGLTEPEGEIEAVLSAGSHVGGTYLAGNLVYGQDPDGNERDGEVRVAVLQPLGTRVFLGLDARLRFDMGSRPATTEPQLDAVAGPVATVVAGPVALLLQGGVAALRMKGSNSYGAVVLGGLGHAF
jgi:hypothetical protein